MLQRMLDARGESLYPPSLRCVLLGGGPAPPGAVGEILVRGPSVTIGYINRTEDTARTLRDGWLRTGDLGYRDDEGYHYVVERRAALIISGVKTSTRPKWRQRSSATRS